VSPCSRLENLGREAVAWLETNLEDTIVNTRNIARRVSPCSWLGNSGRVDIGRRRISAWELEWI